MTPPAAGGASAPGEPRRVHHPLTRARDLLAAEAILVERGLKAIDALDADALRAVLRERARQTSTSRLHVDVTLMHAVAELERLGGDR